MFASMADMNLLLLISSVVEAELVATIMSTWRRDAVSACLFETCSKCEMRQSCKSSWAFSRMSLKLLCTSVSVFLKATQVL